MPPTPFLIGVDLGTTNVAVAAVDTRRRNPRTEVFRVPQLIAPGVVEPRPVLPSFLYFPEPDEIAGGGIALPWDRNPSAIVGVLARDRGALAPARQVASAKSWLAHPGVDRHAPFLPWGSTGSTPRISPVDASARYLMHLRDAWNATIASGDEAAAFERQSIVLTVPASFDEEARELTVEAARAAQLSTLTLLEEPIAAFYAWMAEQRRTIALEDEEIALVCDVGGGTTDFSLIRVRIEAGAPSFERVAIGDHLLLGGDNLDLALATIVERRIAGIRPAMRLALTQRSSLRRLCSAAKEQLLGEATADRVPITVLGAGRSLIGDSITLDLTRGEAEAALNEFLPLTRADEESRGRDRRAGLRELGLPYETDPAITRHLAAFLARSAAVFPSDHRAVARTAGRRMIRPDLVLFNGGFFTPPVARERIAQALAGWFGETPRLLATGNLEAAVAVGAATYARLRAGVGRTGSLVKAGSGRAYYIALGCAAGSWSDRRGLRARARDGGRNRTHLRSSVQRPHESSGVLFALQLDDASGSRRRSRLARPRRGRVGTCAARHRFPLREEVAARRAAGPTLGRVHRSRHAGRVVPIRDDRASLAAAVSGAGRSGGNGRR